MEGGRVNGVTLSSGRFRFGVEMAKAGIASFGAYLSALHIARSVPCLVWFTSAPRAGTRLAALSFSLQRVPSGSAVRSSAPALTLKRPLCLSLILTEERPALRRGRGPTPARIREAASPARQGYTRAPGPAPWELFGTRSCGIEIADNDCQKCRWSLRVGRPDLLHTCGMFPLSPSCVVSPLSRSQMTQGTAVAPMCGDTRATPRRQARRIL